MEGLGDGYEAFVERMRFDIASSTSSAPKPRPPPPPPPVPSSSAAASAALPPSSSSSSSSSPYQRYVGYPSTSNAFTVKREAGVPSSEGGGGASADAPLPPSSPEGGGGGGGGGGGRFSSDLNRMPDAPPRTGSHRRAQSEIAFRLPDDLLFEPEPEPEHEHGLGLGLGSDHLPSQSDELWDDFLGSYYYDAEHIAPPGGSSSTSCSNQNDALNTFRHPGGHHSRSLSMDGMAALGFGHSLMPGGKGASSGNSAPSSRHHHSYSMDGSSNYFKHDGLSGDLESVESKKALAAKKLAEIALVDPKRAKRILANRQSAARSKERKMRYIAELECKVQTLQTEATTLSAQLTLLQRDTTGLTSENGELRVRLQSLEQQTQLRDALQDALKEEIQRLKLASAQLSALNGGPAFNLSTPPHVPLAKQFGPGSQYLQHLANQAQGKGGSFGNSLFKQEGGTSSGGSGNLNNVSHSQAL